MFKLKCKNEGFMKNRNTAALLMEELMAENAKAEKESEKKVIRDSVQCLIQELSENEKKRAAASYEYSSVNRESEFYHSLSPRTLSYIVKLTGLPGSAIDCLIQVLKKDQIAAIVPLLKNHFSMRRLASVQKELMDSISNKRVQVSQDYLDLVILALKTMPNIIMLREHKVNIQLYALILSFSIEPLISGKRKDLFFDKHILILKFLVKNNFFRDIKKHIKDFYTAMNSGWFDFKMKSDHVLLNLLRAYLDSHSELLLQALEQNPLDEEWIKLLCEARVPVDQIIENRFISPLDYLLLHVKHNPNPLLWMLENYSFKNVDNKKMNLMGSHFPVSMYSKVIELLNENHSIALDKSRIIFISYMMKVFLSREQKNLNIVLEAYRYLKGKKESCDLYQQPYGRCSDYLFERESEWFKTTNLIGWGDLPNYFILILKAIKNKILLIISENGAANLSLEDKTKIRNILGEKRGFFSGTDSMEIYDLLQNPRTAEEGVHRLNKEIDKNEKALEEFGFMRIVNISAPTTTNAENYPLAYTDRRANLQDDNTSDEDNNFKL